VRIILRAVLVLVLGLAALYAGDYLSARYRIPGNRQTLGSVQVKTLWAIRQKSGKFDYQLGDTVEQPCIRSIFPQFGYTPCWYLNRHASQVIEVSRSRTQAPVVALGRPPVVHFRLIPARVAATE